MSKMTNNDEVETNNDELEQISWRRDAITSGLGVFLVGGVFTDGWAHFNRPGLETFFTPWHAILYSGLGAMTLWLTAVAWRASGGDPRAVRASLPRGYGLAFVGAALFALGGLTDLLWHQIFGIEIAVDALLSPTHLLLGAGGILILSTAMRSQGLLTSSEAGEWTAPAKVSLALVIAVVVFFLLYVSPFIEPQVVETFTPTPESAPGHAAAELPVMAALGSYLVTTLVITLPLIFMTRGRPDVPAGGAVLVVSMVALLPVVVGDLPPVPLAGALGAVVGAAVFESVHRALIRRTGRTTSAWSVPGLMLLLVYSGHLIGLALADALRWPVSLWSGVVVLSALMAAVTGFATSQIEVAAGADHDPAPSSLAE